MKVNKIAVMLKAEIMKAVGLCVHQDFKENTMVNILFYGDVFCGRS